MSRTRQKVEVIVMGAAIAGLASARDLSIDGFDVLVLEARNRIGGRIWTSRDLGARASDRFAWLVHRLICSWHMAAGQLAVFQGASDEHI
jgi:monoamine oxidase